MAITIFILFLFAWAHLVYESTIAPNMRFKLRCDFFKLRDELRNLKLQHEDELSDEVFEQVDSSICSSISHLPFLSFSVIARIINEMDQNKELRDQVNRRLALIESCKVPGIQTITDRNAQLTAQSLLINSGSWFIFLLPMIILVVLIVIFWKSFSTLKSKAIKYTLIPDRFLESILPNNNPNHRSLSTS